MEDDPAQYNQHIIKSAVSNQQYLANERNTTVGIACGAEEWKLNESRDETGPDPSDGAGDVVRLGQERATRMLPSNKANMAWRISVKIDSPV